MKRIFTLLAVTLSAHLAGAQERIPAEDAQRLARTFAAESAKLVALQLKVDGDADRPFGLRKGDIGALVIADKRLSGETLQKLGDEVTPVGQLWMRGITTLVNDEAVTSVRLRIVNVTVNDKDVALPLFLLGARKAGQDLELVVFAGAREPLLRLPLRKAETRQEMPIELEARGEGGRGILTLNILGGYRVELPVVQQE
jgi:hypothetical protein